MSAGSFFEGGPLVFAHRGASAEAPENTEPAFRLALERGAHGLEADIRVTRDGVPVVFHDRRLERLTDGTGPVRGRRYAELCGLDAAHRWSPDGGRTFPFRGRGLRIPAAAELLERFPGVRFIFHIKSAAAGPAARRAVEAAGAAARVLVAAEWGWRLWPFRGYPGLRGATTEGVARLYVACRLGLRPRASRPVFLPPRRYGIRLLGRRLVECAHAAGQPVIAWVINRRDTILKALEWGVDAIETDRPELALDVLRDWSARGRGTSAG